MAATLQPAWSLGVAADPLSGRETVRAIVAGERNRPQRQDHRTEQREHQHHFHDVPRLVRAILEFARHRRGAWQARLPPTRLSRPGPARSSLIAFSASRMRRMPGRRSSSRSVRLSGRMSASAQGECREVRVLDMRSAENEGRHLGVPADRIVAPRQPRLCIEVQPRYRGGYRRQEQFEGRESCASVLRTRLSAFASRTSAALANASATSAFSMTHLARTVGGRGDRRDRGPSSAAPG